MDKVLHISPYIFFTLFIIIVFLSIFSQGVSADPDVGRYNISRPGSDVDVNPIVGCSQGTAQGAKCHLKTEDKYCADPQCPVPSQLMLGDGSDNIVEHPGVNRAPASLYPGWVHRMHGGTSWPRWGMGIRTRADAKWDEGWPSEINITSVYLTSPNAGYADSTIGSGGSIAPKRSKVYQEAAGKMDDVDVDYDSEIIKADTGADTNWGLPDEDDQDELAGCGYGTGAVDGGVSGCHRIQTWDVDDENPSNGTDGDYNRGDTIKCKYCHNGSSGTGIEILSTNTKHGVDSEAQCADCHYIGDNTPTDPDLGELPIIPTVRECWDCHSGKVTPLINTGAHAGKECKYCHGHPHNLTSTPKNDPTKWWNTTCANDDNICHGSGANEPRDIGGGSDFRHGRQGNNATCGNCHIPEGQQAHNITIPSCRNCHNATGIGNASVGESSLYNNTGDNRTNTVPSWDSQNEIYHNSEEKGNKAYGLKCANCHTPDNPSGGKPHEINTTQDSGKNLVPNCRTTRCHGTTDQAPSGTTAGAWIRFSHGEASLSGTEWELSCVDCHNNDSLWMFSSGGNYSVPINTYLHTTNLSGYNITPFNYTRNAPKEIGEVAQSVCERCHDQTTGVLGTCGSAACHYNNSASDGKLIIHDDDMGIGEDLILDGIMVAGGSPNCISCHNSEDPDNNLITVNFTSMNTTFGTDTPMHLYLNNRTGDPGELSDPGAATYNWNNRRCWACHSNGSAPASNKMSIDTSDSSEGRGTYKNPYLCWDCHVVNYTSSGALDWNGSQNSKYPYIKNVTEHIQSEYAPDIKTNTSSSTGKNGTCPICHENDIGETGGSVPSSGGQLTDSLIANVSHYGQNDSLMTSVATENSTNCMYCHGNATVDSPNNETWGGAVQSRYEEGGWGKMGNPTTNAKCWECHVDTKVMPTNFHNETLNPGLGGSPNCISCHDIGGSGPDLNVSSMNTTVGGTSMHLYLNNRTGDPGDTSDLSLQYNWNNRRCWACHSNGSVPNATENKGADGMGVNKTTPWKCWDCHVINYTSSGAVDWRGERNSNFSWAPNVTEHIMEQYAPDINTNTSLSTRKNGTCQICHENDIGNRDGTEPGNTLGMSLIANVSHYGQNDSLPYSSVVNSTSCLFCHNSTANASKWGNATQIFNDINGMYQANESQDCWWCHTDNSQQPTNFHNPILNITTAKCELCHFKYKYFNATQKTKFINETSYNQSVHWNRSLIWCTNCHTNTSFGSARNETHPYQLNGANFLPPESGWKWCEDCHVYQANPKTTQQRHNITDAPQNYYVGGDNVLDITDCTTCHNTNYYNKAKATFNRTSGKDCRWCHTFPELTPDSPY